jgi:hypothetical protein
MTRVYTELTVELEEALEAASDAGLTEKKSAADRLQKWALYGYERWKDDQLQAAKLAAYEEIGKDAERTERVRAAAHRSAEAGLI